MDTNTLEEYHACPQNLGFFRNKWLALDYQVNEKLLPGRIRNPCVSMHRCILAVCICIYLYIYICVYNMCIYIYIPSKSFRPLQE